MVSPQVRREAVDVLMHERGFGVTRACGLAISRRIVPARVWSTAEGYRVGG
jgi:diaminopimelate epimerase